MYNSILTSQESDSFTLNKDEIQWLGAMACEKGKMTEPEFARLGLSEVD